MKILDDGSFYLECGEPVPCFCSCGTLYQPDLHSECSDCPHCSRTNVHALMPQISMKSRMDDDDIPDKTQRSTRIDLRKRRRF